MRTIGNILDKNKNIAPGFDFLRLWLAMSVLWFHSFVVVGTMNTIETTPAWFYIYMIMPMFFALSGFLVAGSAVRLSQKNFILNRLCRIMPALIAQTFIAALILGPVFTTLPLRDYVSDTLFWRYFANIIVWIQYELPGTFTLHPSHAINQSIWSIPFEVTAYIVIMVTTCFKKTHAYIMMMAAFIASLLIVPVICQQAGMVAENGKTTHTILNYLFFTRGSLLFPSFLGGTLCYWLRNHIPFSHRWAAFCIVFSCIIALYGQDSWRSNYLLNLVCVPVIIYFTIYLGCCSMPRLPLYARGDYSYGIYIFGYPIQQILLALFPALMGQWLPHFIASVIFTTVVAMLSWHVLERPILLKRKAYSIATSHLKDSKAST